MTHYNAENEQETYEMFLEKLKENTEKLGIKWVLERHHHSMSGAIRSSCGMH